jgi:hypothetical protein
MCKQLICFLLLATILSNIDYCYSQSTPKKAKNNSSVLTEAEIHKISDDAFSDTRKKFTIIDSSLIFRGVKLGDDLTTVNQFLRIQSIRVDSKMRSHKYGLINNQKFCAIDTFSLIGFADFVNEKLVQLSFESMNQYRYVSSYFVRYFGIPDQYNETSIIWTGKNIRMTVTDNSKVKDKSSNIGDAAINITLLSY